MKTTKILALTFLVCFGTVGLASAQVFNEIRISSPGTEDDVSNFFEIFGIGGASLNNLSVLAISSEFNPGSIDGVIDLTGTSIPGDGFYMGSTDGTEYGSETDIVTGIDFFGSPTSFLLVDGFTGAAGDDIDVDDDGTAETTPWGSIIDSVSLVDGDANADFQYGPGDVVGPDGNFTPAHIFRDVDGGGTWQIGQFGDRSFDTPGFSNVAAVPEPTSGVLAIMMLCGVVARRRR